MIREGALRLSRPLAAGLLLGLAAGCSFSSSSSSKEESWTYSFTENGCSTGSHHFSDKASYCAALRDEGLNRGCAKRAREKAYEDECRQE